MKLLYLIIITIIQLLWNECNGVNFTKLPFQLIQTKIFDKLPKNQIIKTIMTLNNKSYHNYYLPKFKDEINAINKLESILTNCTLTNNCTLNLNLIKNLSK